MNELEQTVENYLARTPSRFNRILKGAHIIPTTELEKGQTVIRQYKTATEEQSNNYVNEISGLNTQVQGLEGTLTEKNNTLDALNNRITQGVLLEGEEAEMYKTFKASIEKTGEITQKISEDVSTQVYKTAAKITTVAKSLTDYFKNNCFKKE